MDSSSNEAHYVWTPPSFDVSRTPSNIYTTSLHHNTSYSSDLHDFARTAKWCPDGSVAIAQTESGCLQYLDLPSEYLGSQHHVQIPNWSQNRSKQPAPLLDFAWYPQATSRDPASFCLVTSVRECPVKLLDANDGRLRASYRIVDHRERQIAPHCLAFNPMASKLYCGFEDAIEVFGVHAPGEGERLKTTPSKKSRDGLKGIISSLAFSNDISSGLFAAGSLNPSPPTSSNIALFTENTGEVPVMFVGDETQQPTGFGIRASVMQVMFNPMKPHMLYASFRRSSSIYCWDLRGNACIPSQIFTRPDSDSEKTNQKLRFDIDLGGNWLAVGDMTGNISMFDLSSSSNAPEVMNSEAPRIDSRLTFFAHNDAIGSTAFHPLKPLLLSVSGSRNFPEPSNDEREGNFSDEEDEEENDIVEFNQTLELRGCLIHRTRTE
ncbi:SWT21/TCAB1 mRNA Splicing and Telomere Maintenance [Abortiporus biennis]